MDDYELGVQLFEDHKDSPLLPAMHHQEMVELAMHLSDYPLVYDVDGIDFEIQLLRPSQIAAAWGLINANLISHEFSEFKPGWVLFKRSHDELRKWLKQHENGLSDADSKDRQPSGSADEWAAYRNGPDGLLLTVAVCKEFFSVSGKELSLDTKAKQTRRKNPTPKVRGFVYRYDVVSLMANLKNR